VFNDKNQCFVTDEHNKQKLIIVQCR